MNKEDEIEKGGEESTLPGFLRHPQLDFARNKPAYKRSSIKQCSRYRMESRDFMELIFTINWADEVSMCLVFLKVEIDQERQPSHKAEKDAE